MKRIIIVLAIVAFTLVSCKKENDKFRREIKNQIVFTAESNTELRVSTFIDRNGSMVYQENTIASVFRKEIEHKLETGDNVVVFAMPVDGKTHVIKTAVYIDGVLQKKQDKVCHAGGGCMVKH